MEKLKHGHTNVKPEGGAGRLSAATTDDNTEHVHDIFLLDD
jgi:hypothetical protein